jgi:tetratricopeptide (TPR) repeat protein
VCGPRALRALALPALLLIIGVATSWGARDESREPVPPPSVSPVASVSMLAEEGMRLYASGQFARACERFGRAWAREPASAARRADVARCFEGWGWDSLRQGRPDEAMLLFQQRLRQSPDSPARSHEDAEVRVLLANLYDRRDDGGRAPEHLRAALTADPAHATARRLVDKVERQVRAEAGFQREIAPHFVVKWRADLDASWRRALLAALAEARERVVGQIGEIPGQRVTVVLYEAAAFQEVARVHAWVTGLFDGKIRLPARGPLPARRELERILAHEYAHAVVHDLTRGRAPRWLHEGLAQALEGAVVDPMLRVPGRPTLTGLEEMLGDPDPVRARAGYDIALWVVRDLLDRGGMPAMRAFMTRLGRGDAIATAVPAVHGLPLAELEHQWRRVLGG